MTENIESNKEYDEILEEEHLQHVRDAFLYYHTSSLQQLERKQRSFNSLSKQHKELIPTLKHRLLESRHAIDKNYHLISEIIKFSKNLFCNSNLGNTDKILSYKPLSVQDICRVRTTLKQIVRDWSSEGKAERDQSYKIILKELINLYPHKDKSDVFVVVPGSGLGRIVFDIARQGFNCQGNEFSMYMLFASNFMLNACVMPDSIIYYPWLHNTSNVFSNSDQLREVKIPDISPASLQEELNYSMTAGDFLQVYDAQSKVDCCVMCFFLDTSHNPISYVEKVYEILKPGGYWINFGPLLYHFSDTLGEISVELTYEELKGVIEGKFKFIKEETCLKTTYVQDSRSMMKTVYDCCYFVVQKPLV